MLTNKESLLVAATNLMHDKHAILIYRKQNGEVRFAVGTTNWSILESLNEQPKYPRQEYYDKDGKRVYHYYDFLVEGWRTFGADSLLFVQGEDQVYTYEHLTDNDVVYDTVFKITEMMPKLL